MRRLLVGALLGIGLVLAAASPALAHAELEETHPSAAAVLADSPGEVRLRFSEAVEVSFGSIRVFDGDGKRLEAGRVRHPDGRSDTVALDVPSLDRGGYVVTWRVLSADSHPVHGAFTFRVGAAPPGADDNQALARRLLSADGGSTGVGAASTAARLLVFAGLLLLVGGFAFVLWLWPAGLMNRRVRRLLAAAWATSLFATLFGIGLQGAYAGGLTLADSVRPSVISAALDTRFGEVSVARLILLAAVAVAWWLTQRPEFRQSLAGRLGAPALGAGLLVTLGLAGHAGTGSRVAVAMALDLAHLGAVSFWLGGLVLLVGAFLPLGDAEAMRRVVPRFSRAAFGAVVVILATGSLQGWRQVGSFDALTSTTFGHLLLVKVALFAGMVGAGFVSRRWVQARYRGPQVAMSVGPGAAAVSDPGADVERLRRSVRAEVVIAVVILAVTSLLVNAVPAKTALAKPFSAELETPQLLIDITVDPAKAGATDLHLYTLTPEGQVTDVAELTATLSLPERNISPIEVPLTRAGPGHFSAYGTDLPIRGRWRLEVVARLNDVDQVRASTIVPVR